MNFINLDNKSLEHYGSCAHQSSEISSLKKREKFCLFFCVPKNLQRKYFLWGYLRNTVGCFVGDFKPTDLIFLICWLGQK